MRTFNVEVLNSPKGDEFTSTLGLKRVSNTKNNMTVVYETEELDIDVTDILERLMKVYTDFTGDFHVPGKCGPCCFVCYEGDFFCVNCDIDLIPQVPVEPIGISLNDLNNILNYWDSFRSVRSMFSIRMQE